MKQFNDVFAFEFLTLLKKKTVKVTTIVLCLIVLVGTSLPTIIKLFNDDSKSGNTAVVETAREIGILDSDYNYLVDVIFNGDNIHEYKGKEALENAVVAGEVELGMILYSDVSFELIIKDRSLDNYELEMITSYLQELKMNQNLIDAGINPTAVFDAGQVEIAAEMTVLGRNSLEGYFIGFGIILIVYMMIILYGQTVATSVAREKDSRTMELLITSTNPKTLILGKVLANSLFGILQITLLIVCAIIGFLLNRGNYPPEILVLIQGSMDFNTAIVYILFSSIGYCMYLFLYGAFGSLVSRLEDVGTAISPIMFVFIAAYMIASMSMSMPNSLLSVVSSYIPFTALFIMPIRNMLTSISIIEILISLGLMILTTYLMIVVSVYIYRRGSLNYGNKVKISSLIKGLIKKEDH
jgi:ABC-type Na+ efflux pump, permease component